MAYVKNLSEISVGERAEVKELRSHRGIRARLIDLGLVPETVVECVGISPSGDPRAYLIRGAVVAIRKRDARDIIIRS